MRTLFDDIKERYSLYSITDFWNWLTYGQQFVIEVRVLPGKDKVDWKFLKQVADTHGLICQMSSFFVTSAEELQKILSYKEITENHNIYYGINPRKKMYMFSKYSKRVYQQYGGKLESVKQIQILPFDIEACDRKGLATDEQLKNAMLLCDAIIETFRTAYGWNDYCIVCSGNGIHLLYRFDFPIVMPELQYEVRQKIEQVIYKQNKDFVSIKSAVNNFLKKIVDKFQHDEDGKTGWMFNAKFDMIGDATRVLRLPFTYNNKPTYKEKRLAGVIHMNQGRNAKMFDRISKLRSKILINPQGVARKYINDKHVYTKHTIKSAPIVKLMLMENLPEGDRNHYLEFQLALLLKDNNIDVAEIPELISELNASLKKKVNLSAKYLKDDEHFNPEIVNNWCIKYMIQPVYEIRQNMPILIPMLKDLKITYVETNTGRKLDSEFPECIEPYKKDFKRCAYSKMLVHSLSTALVSNLIMTIGKERTKFLCETGILARYLIT